MVSIIIPTYNRAHLIAASIKSVLAQTYSDFELIIIDDGSEDNSDEIIASFSDKRIRYFKKSHTGHTSILKNFALSIAKGNLIAFNDSDDLWKPEKLQKQVQLMNENEAVGFCISDVTTFNNEKILIEHSYKLQGTIEYRNIFSDLKDGKMLVYNPTLIIRKKCFDEIGNFNEAMFSGDYQFNMRLAYNYKAAIIYETLVLRRSHDTNMSELMPFENYAEYIETYDFLYRNNMIGITDMCKAKSNAFFKMANIHSKNENAAKAFKNYITSFKYGVLVPKHFLRLIYNLKFVTRR